MHTISFWSTHWPLLLTMNVGGIVVPWSILREDRVPTGVGWIPGCIGSQYGGFTANPWKNWVLVYSSVVLKGLLPTNDCLFMHAPIMKINDINSADLFSMQF